MTKELYIIEYESMHWCGGGSHCLVWAESGDEAIELASDHMEESMRELFSDEIEEDDLDAEMQATVNSVELVIGSTYEKYVRDPSQQTNFYPLINGTSIDEF